MRKVEFKKRLKGLGMGLDSFRDELGLATTTYRNWVEIPEKCEWWLLMKEARRDLDRILERASRWRGR